MIHFPIDQAYRIPPSRDRVAELCWDAQEIFACHMRVAKGLVIEDESEGYDEDAIDNEQTLDDATEVVVHTTPPIPINQRLAVTLSNVPYIRNDFDRLIPYTEAGYVALIGDPVRSLLRPQTQRPYGGLEQLIFRVPKAFEPAAIFEGFSFADTCQVPRSDSSKLAEITRLLSCIRLSLRNIVEMDMVDIHDRYHSQVPTPVVSHLDDAALDELRNYFND